MINRKQLRKTMERETMKSGFVRWLDDSLSSIDFNLSDEHCTFLINSHYEVKGHTIIIQLFCVPQIGIFKGIEFRPKVYINSADFMEKPRVFNDRRVFHPNINLLTCELSARQLVEEWSPAVFDDILRQIKYIILEPNCTFVPNNPYNRKAAWHFHYNKHNYWKLIIQNCPLRLDNLIGGRLTSQLQKMELEEEEGCEDEFWSIDKTISKKRQLPSVFDEAEDESFNILEKGIKKLEIQQSSQDETASEISEAL